MPTPDKKTRRRTNTAWQRALSAQQTRLIRVRRGNNNNNNNKKSADSGPGDGGAASDHPLHTYMVLEHGFEDPAYSVLELAAGAVPRSLLHVSAGTSFAAVPTRRGPRIVGVGLVYPKLHPVLIPHGGGRLYALTRTPSVVQGRDFVPWFLVADFSTGAVVDGGTVGSRWRQLPPPPVFPCRLNPLEYRDPPKVRVESYAVVGARILLSVRSDVPEGTETEARRYEGTCAFDVDAKQWEMVDHENLPFVGQAVHLGGRRFVARSRTKGGGAAAVYDMDVLPPGNTSSGKTELSIVELEVVSKGIVPGQLLCSMAKDSFASFDVRWLDPSPETKWDRARIVHRTYSVVSMDDAGTNSVVVVKQHRHIFKVRGQYTRLARPSPVVAALSM
ncbi:hypothetical protein PR202_gb22159 [Eleusine coracana subsp. coracana]|uniref:Uncharacterized protein n=1 Tax=Eleusine coracana subsp. coracana TaxID=191504 RepID=A0AAV5FFV3_ELECO|nr:hypothetical protein QOZ80_6AG0540520 [Eleusine coracana subsp. coracana]GJN33547.1 hypothetical protein PR202_gb22159 [Eleusine coracana subsp. coracana]